MSKSSDFETPTASAYVPNTTLAELLHCHPRTIDRLAKRGIIPPPVNLGGLRRWELSRVLATMQEQSHVV